MFALSTTLPEHAAQDETVRKRDLKLRNSVLTRATVRLSVIPQEIIKKLKKTKEVSRVTSLQCFQMTFERKIFHFANTETLQLGLSRMTIKQQNKST